MRNAAWVIQKNCFITVMIYGLFLLAFGPFLPPQLLKLCHLVLTTGFGFWSRLGEAVFNFSQLSA